MSQLLDQLSPHMRAFFEAFFAGSASADTQVNGQPVRSLEQLQQAVGPELEITVGRYRAYCGQTIDIHGHPFLPRGAVHVERDLVFFTGTDRRITFYQAPDPTPPTAAAPGTAPAPGSTGGTPGTAAPGTGPGAASGTTPTPGAAPGTGATPVVRSNLPPYQYTLVRMVERLDPVFDTAPTMRRLLASLDAPRPDQPAPTGAPSSRAGAWAEALAAQQQRDANLLRLPLERLSSPPTGVPARDLEEYKQVMYRLATYLRDGMGTYYPKQIMSVMGANGLPAAFPEGTTDEYRAINAREIALEPGQIYCLANLPDGWGTGVDRQAGVFKEIVWKLSPAAGGGTELIPISWGTRVIGWGNARPRDFFDFCFFIAEAITAPERDEPPPPPEDNPPQ